MSAVRAAGPSATADEPVPDERHHGLDLVGAGECDLRPAPLPAQLGVHRAVRLAAASRPGSDQRVELLAQLGQAAVVDDRRSGLPTACPAPGDLVGLPLPQQRRDLVGVEEPGQPEEVELLLGADVGPGAELAAVEEHPVEGRLRIESLERADDAVRPDGDRPVGVPVRLGEQAVLQVQLALVLERTVQGVVTLELEGCGEREELRDARQEDRGRLPASPDPDEATDSLGEEQRRGRGRGVDANG